MPLTKGDKLIIIGAVVLALAVVAGLAAWRKPHLFTGVRPAPTMTDRDFTAPTPAPPAPPAESSLPDAAPPRAAGQSPSLPAPTPQAAPASASPARNRVSETASLPVPVPGASEPAAPPAANTPPTSAPPAPKAEPVSPEIVSQHPLFAGDQALDQMFSDMGQEAAASKVDTGKKAAHTPPVPDAAPSPPAPAPQAPPEAAEALDVPAPSPGPSSKKPVKDKPAPAGKPAAGPSRGAVVAVSASDKPGEYVLTVTTTSPVGEVTRTYMDGPPRLVIDLAGRWTYTGPLSLSGKSPLIRLVRVGKHADRLRLVLDLAPEAVARLREAPVVDRTPNGVVIRLPK